MSQVTQFAIGVALLLGAAFYFMSPDERARVLRAAKTRFHDASDAVTLQGLGCDSFFSALRARTRRVIITPYLIGLSAVMTVLAGAGSAKWWHLLTTIFGYARVLDLVVGAICLLQIGLILERLLGRLPFITIYVACGAAAGVVSLALSPDGVSGSASASVLGLYAVLLVTSIWGVIHRTTLTIPLQVAKRLGAVAAMFVVYHLAMSDLGNPAQVVALVAGLIGGVIVAREANDYEPSLRPLAFAMAAMLAIVTVSALIVMRRPVNAVTDVRPEIQRVIAVEHRTADLYDHAVETFRKGRMNTAALADLIEDTIVPELHALTARVDALQDVPPADRPLVETVREFLKLRDESWRLRAAALLDGDPAALRQADNKEQASLEAFHRIALIFAAS
jgi:membrane associated rhomboid family serine protease